MKKNFWKENGILISLYGVVGVLVVTAGILTVNTLTPTEDIAIQENVEVQSSLVESYKQQIAKMQEENNDNEIEKLKESLKEHKNQEDEEVKVSEDKLANPSQEEAKPSPNDDLTTSKKDEEQIEEKQMEEETESNEENKTSSTYEENNIVVSNQVTKHELEKINKENDEKSSENKNSEDKSENMQDSENLEISKLTWPIEGSIIMSFNNEALVYDETLNLYRTNESISIMADKGDEVVASANGKIIDIGSNVTDRGYIVVEHGNGYTTKYSQLVENFIVSKGDQVRRGQIIGHIGEPASVSARQGTHLQYAIAKDEVNIDPIMYLE